MVIGKYIYQRLLAHAGTSALVGPRIFAHLAPTEAARPYIVYSVVSVEPFHTKSGPADVERVRVQIDAYGTNYSNAVAVGQEIRTAIDYVTDPSGATASVFIDGCHFVNAQNDLEEIIDLHRYIQDFAFRVKYIAGAGNALSVATIALTHAQSFTISGATVIPLPGVFIQYVVITAGTGNVTIQAADASILFDGEIESMPLEIAIFHQLETAQQITITGACTALIYYIQR